MLQVRGRRGDQVGLQPREAGLSGLCGGCRGGWSSGLGQRSDGDWRSRGGRGRRCGRRRVTDRVSQLAGEVAGVGGLGQRGHKVLNGLRSGPELDQLIPQDGQFALQTRVGSAGGGQIGGGGLLIFGHVIAGDIQLLAQTRDMAFSASEEPAVLIPLLLRSAQFADEIGVGGGGGGQLTLQTRDVGAGGGQIGGGLGVGLPIRQKDLPPGDATEFGLEGLHLGTHGNESCELPVGEPTFRAVPIGVLGPVTAVETLERTLISHAFLLDRKLVW